ncbi:MAG: hypothetical protein BroJett029_18930 [Alphaproteobacteria bacterium]|nr:MAG: hypothetical protein BroJett029_18930 [Alphaproteobacteria bacterium]
MTVLARASPVEPPDPAAVAALMRPPDEVMRLARLGAFHQTRLSFARTLVRRMGRERWRFSAPLQDLDADGYGTVVYRIDTPAGPLSFVAFSNPLTPEERTDRVIAERWDTAFALVAGPVDGADIARLREAVPRQEAGRFTAAEIVLSRANRSLRIFEHVVDCLSQGRQPELARLVEIGYLLRTTAVYGNGKFGIADLERVWRHGVFALPYQAEMLTVYLVRQFGFDLVDHIARSRNPAAASLDAASRRALGVGNATGLGMAPYLVGHPKLLNAWIAARETALARVRAVEALDDGRLRRLGRLFDRAGDFLRQWRTDDCRQQRRIETLKRELESLRPRLGALPPRRPWDHLFRATQTAGAEAQEMVASLLIELYPELVDDLEDRTGADEHEAMQPAMTLASLQALIERHYGWAIAQRYDADAARHFFWYRSAEKDEPRLGARFQEPGADRELPIGIGLLVSELYGTVAARAKASPDQPVGLFLLAEPRWRGIVRRVQDLAGLPYAEIRDNLLGETCLPIDLLRCKLAIFGASKFDPKSDRWTRITLFQGAPPIDDLERPDADDWLFPAFPV